MRSIGIKIPSKSKELRDYVHDNFKDKTFTTMDIPREVCSQQLASSAISYCVKVGEFEVVGKTLRQRKNGKTYEAKVFRVAEKKIAGSAAPKFSRRSTKTRKVKKSPLSLPVYSVDSQDHKAEKFYKLQNEIQVLMQLTNELLQEVGKLLRD